MSRIPPNLLYLTIYNPSLRPTGPIPDDDEDAEEQAHILFYTSKERAVSRDRMLRQVGLAKALVNFSEMFNANDSCNSVHSQSRRMIMVSPEPDFWIHAGIEVAKVPRAIQDKGKSKPKDKGKEKAKGLEKGKGKETEMETGPVYDFLEGSVHDIALRQDILRGYERFKLTHGSFTSILSTLGQHALELQLERFFTIWAWTWNLEDGQDFKEHLGIPLHPRFRSLVQNLDAYSLDLPNAIILSPPHTIPSSAYSAAQYPPSLARHLLSLVPRNHSSTSNAPPDTSEGTIKAKRLPEFDTPGDKDPPATQGPSTSNFLGIPPVNMNVDMDIRKWNWPGYLTFGRGTSKRPGLDDNKKLPTAASELESGDARSTIVEVDTDALEDAISSDNTSITSSSTPSDGPVVHEATDVISGPKDDQVAAENSNETEQPPINIEQLQTSINVDPVSPTSSTPPSELGSPSQTPSLQFASTTVYLSDPDNPLLTLRQKVYYVLHAHMMLALIGVNDSTDPENPGEHPVLQSAGTNAMKLFEEIEDNLNDVSKSTDTLPSATKILQPTDSHIASSAHFTVSSPAFASKSSHLYNAREMQAIDPEISEVFSRGQNPQHWHIARRGLGYNEGGEAVDGEVFLEVFRKEASLTDVDNVLAGVVRKCHRVT